VTVSLLESLCALMLITVDDFYYAAFVVLCPYTDILGENVKLVVLTKM